MELTIAEKRQLIKEQLISSDLPFFSIAFLERMNSYYKDHFDVIPSSVSEAFKFDWNTRMHKCAGRITYHYSLSKEVKALPQFKIEFAKTIIARNHFPKLVNGIEAQDKYEAVMLVFEHEIVHAYEKINLGKSDCSTKRFLRYAENFFGHKKATHGLEVHFNTQSSNTSQQKSREGVITRKENNNAKKNIRKGVRYSVTIKGIKCECIVTWMGSVRGTVEIVKGLLTGKKYRIPYAMLSEIKEEM